jgi:hypothetical protein
MDKAQKHILKLAVAELETCEDKTEWRFLQTLPAGSEIVKAQWIEMRQMVADYRAAVENTLEHLKALT